MGIFDEYVTLGVVAGILAFAAYAWYWFDTWVNRNNPKKGTKPNAPSWLMLTIVSAMVLYGYIKGGAEGGVDGTIWTPLGVLIGTAITFLLALKYGEGGWKNKLDRVCLMLAVVSVALWVYLMHGNIEELKLFGAIVPTATVLLVNALLLDFVALLPTIGHALRKPSEEIWVAWTITEVADILTIFAAGTFVLSFESFNIFLYPVYMTLVNGIVVYIVLRWRFFGGGRKSKT